MKTRLPTLIAALLIACSAGAQNQPSKPEPEALTLDTIVQEIAGCLLASAPQGWRTAQAEVSELPKEGEERRFEGIFTYTIGAEAKALPLIPCDTRSVALNIYRLNDALEPGKRNWTKATLSFTSDGRFELKYDYPKLD